MVLSACSVPAYAARPLLDQHQWDKYFALFARDQSVPWQPATVRLDTYSGTSLEFTVYNVDPADVIVAGSNRMPRPLATAHRKPVARWRFSPPPGYRFEANTVRIPLGSQEGFYVVQARRGNAVQQVWLNRTHIGLLAADSPQGLVVWGVDLRTGRAIPHMALALLVGRSLLAERTDGAGLFVWRGTGRPAFVLAQSGAGRAFLSVLPQAPVPDAIVGIRLDAPLARAGERVRFIGFARRRSGGAYRRASGVARITIAGHGKTLATTESHVDASGAFSGELTIPPQTPAGDYAVLADAASATGGATLHVDAASDVTLSIRAYCPCDPARDVPLAVVARRGALPAPRLGLRVLILRSPHVIPPGESPDVTRWGTTVISDATVRTDVDGIAKIAIHSPTDGLDSTYAIRASTPGASATSSIVVPNAPVALALDPAQSSADVGAPIAFDVRAFEPADGAPVPHLTVRVRLSHGASSEQESITLGAHGRGRAVFHTTYLGSNLALAQVTVGGHTALDAAAVVVEPTALAGRSPAVDDEVQVTLDRTEYRPGQRMFVQAIAPGATGDALIALTGLQTYAVHRVPLSEGRATTSFLVSNPQGDVHVDVACVHDGAIGLGSSDVTLDAAGHEVPMHVTLDRPAYGAGETAEVALRGGDAPSPATLAIRIADARPSGAAYFGDAGDLLATGATIEETPAAADPQWHAFVEPAGSKAGDIFAAEQPHKLEETVPSIGAGSAHTVYWRVERGDGDTFAVPVPAETGRYVLSVLRITQNGDVGAASTRLDVR